MNISEEITKRASDIETRIKGFLPEQYEYQKTIVEAMSYSVLAGGKRLRPMLMEASYQMFGGEGEELDAFMAAIEMIHTYSLVHDDLPAMDNDLYRRGKKTTHAVYGEAMGVLAGDALLNFAFETVADAMVRSAGDMRVAKAFAVLAKKAGIYGMIGGQVVDVESEKSDEEEKKNITRDKLDFIYKLKTSALIESSMMIGAILAGTTEEEVSKVEFIAQKLGLAFQIQDDVLDVTGSFEEIGKPILSDEKNKKTTFVSLKGLDISKKTVNRMSNEAVQIIRELECDNTSERDFLVELVMSLVNRRS